MPKNKIHIIGIAGAGASAVAVMLKDLGHEVSGSDDGFYEPTTSYLKAHDIKILSPYRKENIPADANLIVIGKHAKLNPEENEEVRFALEQKEKIRSFPEILGEVTKDKENIVVAGSYGKSTCAALLTWCLMQAGTEAGYFFGAIPIGFKQSAQMGKAKYFVLEGDEYPAYGGDSKFLYLHPHDLLLTSVEHDHVNVFPTEESYIEPYKKLVKMLPTDGLLVADILNPNVKEVVENSRAQIVTYGIGAGVDWYPLHIRSGMETIFDLYRGEEKIVELSTSLLGIHNIENIVGVSAYLLEKKLITVEKLQEAVESFEGLKRRIDLKTDKSTVLVYEGFGSSYKKAKTIFDALKLNFPGKRIVTLFEPHTFSWRNKNNLNWYSDIFTDSDETIIWNPPEFGKDTHEQISLEDILNEVKKTKKNVYGVVDKDEVLTILDKIVKPEDIIVLISSGHLGGLIEEIPTWAEKKFPK